MIDSGVGIERIMPSAAMMHDKNSLRQKMILHHGSDHGTARVGRDRKLGYAQGINREYIAMKIPSCG